MIEAASLGIEPEWGREGLAAESVEVESRGIGAVENGIEAEAGGKEPESGVFDTD